MDKDFNVPVSLRAMAIPTWGLWVSISITTFTFITTVMGIRWL
jgi:hypothetical protein